MKEKVLNCFGGIVVVLLIGLFTIFYLKLPNYLTSEFDEGYFYTTSVFSNEVEVYTTPPSMATEMIHVLTPDIHSHDILSLRQYAFIASSIALIFFLFSSCVYMYRRYAEKKVYSYFALIASCLLLSIGAFPTMVINWNTIIYICVTVAFSLCLLSSIAPNRYIRYSLIVMIGIVALFLFLVNLPACCMLLLLCYLFLILDGGCDIIKAVSVALFGLLGMAIGLLITHLFIIPIPAIHSFFLDNIANTTAEGENDAHNIQLVILVILFAVRNLIITTLLLCGITYICKIIQRQFAKPWLTIAIGFVCFFIIYKWQAKPQIYAASIIAWFTIMFLVHQVRHKAIEKHELLLVLFAFCLPIGTVFGTDVDVLRKAVLTSASWGFLLFYLYYLIRPEIRKYTLLGWIILAFVIVEPSDFLFAIKQSEASHFEQPTPVSRMNLTDNQKAFYDEVYDELSNHGYQIGKDTLLGFCFNQMTVVAMGAFPYTNDAQPTDFLRHDLTSLPSPKYIIFSEWDSITLYNRLLELDWNFPDRYSYYKCVHCANPELKNKLNHTQSMIYCRKEECCDR